LRREFFAIEFTLPGEIRPDAREPGHSACPPELSPCDFARDPVTSDAKALS